MFHKRLLKEFKDNRKMIVGMVTAQWVMLLANIVLMLFMADFISNLFRGAEGINQSDQMYSLGAVAEAARKAAVYDFISSLPQGYNTKLSELGESVSGGERQRIGIARAFLHQSKVILLDEPTSNIDSLNEGMILQSLNREKQGKTIILVSHRKSTMGIADRVITM